MAVNKNKKSEKKQSGTTDESLGRVRFYIDGELKTVSLKRFCREKDIPHYARKVLELVEYRKMNEPYTARQNQFLEELPEKLREKLDSVGLIPKEKRFTIEQAIDEYFETEGSGLSFNAVSNKRTAFNHLVRLLGKDVNGKDRLLDSVTPAEAQAFKKTLAEDGYATETIRTILAGVKRLYSWAVEKEYTSKNPFANIKKPKVEKAEAEEDLPVPMETFSKMLAVIDERKFWKPIERMNWRILLTLCRIQGMRSKEAVLLKWNDIDELIINIDSTKNGFRQCPLWGPTRTELQKLKDYVSRHPQEKVDDGFILSDTFREEKIHPITGEVSLEPSNKRNIVYRILADAGIPKYGDPLHALRATRANEVRDQFGEYRENIWIGHCKQTARNNYFKNTKADMRKAALEPVETDCSVTAGNEEKTGEKNALNAVNIGV